MLNGIFLTKTTVSYCVNQYGNNSNNNEALRNLCLKIQKRIFEFNGGKSDPFELKFLGFINDELAKIPMSHLGILPKNGQENKIKWKSSPIHFGYLINELINKGYFDNLPQHNGETNYSEIARVFSSIIDFDTSEQVVQKSFQPHE